MGRAENEALRILQQNGEAFQSDIMRATGFSRSTISEALANLEKRKMIRRMREGRNSRLIYLGSRNQRARRLKLGFARAAEYPFLVPLRKILREDGLDVDFHIYDNGVAVARDLATFRLDIGIAPLVTLFIMHSLDGAFKVIGPAGAGGSSVLESPRKGTHGDTGTSAVCTKMSTMEILMRSAESHHDIPEIARLAYAFSPSEIELSLLSGKADVCSIWEPYATMLESKGARRVVRYSDLGDDVCCVAAAGTHLGDELIARISSSYTASLEALRRSPSSYTDAYAALSGIESSTLRRVEREYTYPEQLSGDSVVSQLQATGVKVPSPPSFKDVLFRDPAP
ncbi:MAG TPA: MarR family transcriptional regulator [Nitrososphaerales archaeon]|nr:MarR family transcriptional regulator [Nitrososphaerales archaeon]